MTQRFDELQKELGELSKPFLHLMLMNLMEKKKIDFVELSETYVRHLERQKSDNWSLTADLAYSLMHHRHPELVGGATKKEKQDFIDEKALSALRRTKLFPETAKL